VLGQIVTRPGIEPLGNFSYTIYGQAVGGKGWTQIFIDHPEVNGLSGAKKSQAIYRLTLDEIKRNPSGLITGFLKAWEDFFVPSMFASFGFIQPGDKYSSSIIQIILTIFLFIGLFQSWQLRKQDIHLFLLAVSGGILVSIPFIPPSETAYMRVYAVTLVIPSLLACIGASTIIQKWITPSSANSPWLPGSGLFSVGLGLLLVSITLIGSLLIHMAPHGDKPLGIDCPSGSFPILFKLSTGSYISVATNESGQQTYVPLVSARSFRQSLRAFPGVYSSFSRFLIETITPPILLTFSRNQITGDFIWLITPPELAANAGTNIYACGKTISPDFPVAEVQPATPYP
jgi:hypothetical protein